MVLARDPICRGCQRAVSTVDDHIVPITAGGSATDLDNQQGVCVPCHGFKIVAEQYDPSVFDGFDTDGAPKPGRPRLSPDIPVAAASFDQANLVFGAARAMIKGGPLREFCEVFETDIMLKDRPRQARASWGIVRGYWRTDLEPVFDRYPLPLPPEVVQAVQVVQANPDGASPVPVVPVVPVGAEGEGYESVERAALQDDAV